MAENEQKVGEVTHFFAGPSAAVLKLSAAVKVGDQIHIVGFTTDLIEKLTSMQIDHNNVQNAGPGDDVAILVKDRVREGDEVFLVPEGAMVAAKPMSMTPAPAAPVIMPAAPKPAPAAPKPVAAAKPAPKAAAKPRTKAKAKAKAKPKAKAKAKVKKAKPKAKAKAKKSKAKAKKKKR